MALLAAHATERALTSPMLLTSNQTAQPRGRERRTSHSGAPCRGSAQTPGSPTPPLPAVTLAAPPRVAPGVSSLGLRPRPRSRLKGARPQTPDRLGWADVRIPRAGWGGLVSEFAGRAGVDCCPCSSDGLKLPARPALALPGARGTARPATHGPQPKSPHITGRSRAVTHHPPRTRTPPPAGLGKGRGGAQRGLGRSPSAPRPASRRSGLRPPSPHGPARSRRRRRSRPGRSPAPRTRPRPAASPPAAPAALAS